MAEEEESETTIIIIITRLIEEVERIDTIIRAEAELGEVLHDAHLSTAVANTRTSPAIIPAISPDSPRRKWQR